MNTNYFSIIIPSYKRTKDLQYCLDSIHYNSSYKNEIIVLYNEEDIETKRLCIDNDVNFICDNARLNGRRVKSLWQIINDGIYVAKSNYVMYLNDDCLVEKNWDLIALKYFQRHYNLALLVLRTKGIGNDQNYRVIDSLFGFPCANYGIINKKYNIFFNDKFSWFYGDADLPLKIACDKRRLEVISTVENMVVHNHTVDDNRKNNESDERVSADELYFYRKWQNYVLKNGILKRMNVLDFMLKIIKKVFS